MQTGVESLKKLQNQVILIILFMYSFRVNKYNNNCKISRPLNPINEQTIYLSQNVSNVCNVYVRAAKWGKYFS